ncbi:MAG TPA: hypothetical protein PLU53_12980 [Bacteroidia bacterium]|nr:hypothetical protein [Bacteroidia bacterium]
MLKDKVWTVHSLSWIYSGIFAFLLFAIAWLWMKPSPEPAFHGILFSDLSREPFNFTKENPVQYRLLSPLIAFLTGLRGEYFFVLPWIFLVGFIVLIQKVSFFDPAPFYSGFIKAAFLSFSFMIFLSLASAGYVDSVTWFLLLFCLLPNLKGYVLSVFLLFSLLNHESAVFAFPGILYWRHRNEALQVMLNKMIREVLPVLIIYSGFRICISTLIPVKYDLNYYFNVENIIGNIHANLPRMLQGAFFTFRFAWIFPVWALVESFRKRDRKISVALVLMLLSPFLQLFIAYDITRLLCLCFPAVLLSFDYLYKQKKMPASILAGLIILFNLLLPVYVVGKDTFLRIL